MMTRARVYRTFCIAILFMLCCIGAHAQLWPAEGSKLHYRLAGFSCPKGKKADAYRLEIARGTYNNEEEFRTHIILTDSGSNCIIASLPLFGVDYTWRMSDGKARASSIPGALHHFSVLASPFVDTSLARLRVTVPAAKYESCFVALDEERVIYDMRGNPVWFLPDIQGVVTPRSVIRDLKPTPFGTLTFLCNEKAYEINYNAEVLWVAPDNGRVSGDTTEHYHHDFTRLRNGNYMVLGNEYVHWRISSADFGNAMKVFDAGGRPMANSETNERLEFGTVIEYNTKGDVLWSWKSSSYFKATYGNPHRLKKEVLQSHENAFSFDEDSKSLYVSFKTPGLLLKVAYPGGEVLADYGKKYDSGTTTVIDNTFCGQHSCSALPGGRLCLFNNNICQLSESPGVLVLAPATSENSVSPEWSFNYPLQLGGARRPAFTQGGSVQPLDAGSFFVSMCSPWGNIFIVNRQKQLEWDAQPERRNVTRQIWEPVVPYRAVLLTRQVIETLINKACR